MKFGQLLALGSFILAAASYVRDGATIAYAVWVLGAIAQASISEFVDRLKTKETTGAKVSA